MKGKVFVIGAGSTEIARKVLEIEQQDIEIVLVNSIEDIPLEERAIGNNPNIQEIIKFSAPPPLPQLTSFIDNKGKKGHQRPYKFHK
jgi:hypothetical protein